MFTQASGVVNSMFGVSCNMHLIKQFGNTEQMFPDIMVIVNKEDKIKNEFKMVVGHRMSAKILKSDVESEPRGSALLQSPTGVSGALEVFELGDLIDQNKTSWTYELQYTDIDFPTA